MAIMGQFLIFFAWSALAGSVSGSASGDHLALYRPGTGVISVLEHVRDRQRNESEFLPVYVQRGPTALGIGGYDLRSPADRIFAFDWNKSYFQDHLVMFRPGSGRVWILKYFGNAFAPVYKNTQNGAASVGGGIGGYDLRHSADKGFAFDYESSGRQDHILFYRPGTGTIWILKNEDGVFKPVYAAGDPGNGIGSYDLRSPADRAFAFDYDHSGKCDHLVLYRPGTGLITILKNNKRSGGQFSSVFRSTAGIGGYDLRSAADRAFAYDYESSGSLDHLVLYRPGTGAIFILRNQNGAFSPVYAQGEPGQGIGGYDLRHSAGRALAFDFDAIGKMDHLLFYRPGSGAVVILKNDEGNFTAVFSKGDRGQEIGGYDLSSPVDRVLAFDYTRFGARRLLA